MRNPERIQAPDEVRAHARKALEEGSFESVRYAAAVAAGSLTAFGVPVGIILSRQQDAPAWAWLIAYVGLCLWLTVTSWGVLEIRRLARCRQSLDDVLRHEILYQQRIEDVRAELAQARLDLAESQAREALRADARQFVAELVAAIRGEQR